jgi:hypothetical protein
VITSPKSLPENFEAMVPPVTTKRISKRSVAPSSRYPN